MEVNLSQIKPALLVTGVTGGLARQLVVRLRRRYTVIGVDTRTPTRKLVGVDHFYRFRYTQNGFENIFRNHQIDKIIHLGRISHTGLQSGSDLVERFNQNIVGSKKLLNLGIKYGVKQVIILSSFHVYGAVPDNPIFLKEDSHLRASVNFPEIRDLVELDTNSHIWMYEHKDKVKTLILRPTNIVGPLMYNAITRYFRGPLTPTLMGYDPIIQAVHERDMSRLLELAIETELQGIYNVASDETVPLKRAIELSGSTSLPLPYTLVMGAAKTLRAIWKGIPPHLIDFFRFPCVIDGGKLLRDLPEFEFKYSTEEALRTIDSRPRAPANFLSSSY